MAEEREVANGAWGVLLLQMGGPGSLDEVEGYIERLFADPNLVQLPWPVKCFQKRLARRVARRRSPEVRDQYRQIGGGSPNNPITIAQAARLERLLAAQAPDGVTFRCYAAMGYTEPSVESALRQAVEDGCKHFVALSMFPQYSMASSGASFADLEASADRVGVDPASITRVERWGSRPDYLDALAAHTRATLEAARAAHPAPAHLVVSAHGLPVSYVKRGDPYVDEVQLTVAGLRERLPRDQVVTLSFQSRATPVKWVEPATDATLVRLGNEGVKNLVVLPVSFVNDHIETLYEIDIQLADVARDAGVEEYRRVPVFNDGDDLAAILAALVREAIPVRRPADTAPAALA